MKDIGLKTKMFGIRQDKITYFNLKLKVKVTLTSFDSNTPSCLNIYIHTKQGRGYPKMKCTQICLKVWWRITNEVILPHLAEVALPGADSRGARPP